MLKHAKICKSENHRVGSWRGENDKESGTTI